MSSFKKKTKTTSQQTATTTPNVPDWFAGPTMTAAKQVSDLQARPVSDFAPQISKNLQSTFDEASGLTTAPDYSEARGLLGGVNYDLTGASAADDMGKYRDLFSKDVINPVLADFDENAGKVRAAQAADGARNGAFRGARFGLREGQTEGELARGRASTYGGLLKDAANFALTGASGDAARRQAAQEGNRTARFQGSGLLADIAGRVGNDTRANLALKGALAGQENELQNAIRQAPLDVQAKIQGLLAGLNPALFTGQTINTNGTSTSKSSGGFLGDFLLALASSGGKAASAAAGGG